MENHLKSNEHLVIESNAHFSAFIAGIEQMIVLKIREEMDRDAEKKYLLCPPGWCKAEQAMRMLDVSRSTLVKMEKDGEIPPHAIRRVGSDPRYSLAWLSSHQEAPVKS